MFDQDFKITIEDSSMSYRDLPSYHMKKHSHEALQILIPFSGSNFEIFWTLEDGDSDSKNLLASDISIIAPLLEHEIRWIRKAHFINFYITPNFIKKHVSSCYEIGDRIIETKIGIRDDFIFNLAKSIKQTLENPDEKGKNQEKNQEFFKSSIIILSNHILNNYCLKHTKEKIFNSYEQIPCEKIRDAAIFMSQNLDRNLSIDEIAAEIKMNSYYFIRQFKENLGTSPAKFHLSQRIEKAKSELSKNKKIIDVALDLGFSSQSHFSTAFLKETGQTPKEFQRKS